MDRETLHTRRSGKNTCEIVECMGKTEAGLVLTDTREKKRARGNAERRKDRHRRTEKGRKGTSGKLGGKGKKASADFDGKHGQGREGTAIRDVPRL